MFGFLKDKIRTAISRIPEEVEELPEEAPKEEVVEKPGGIVEKIKRKVTTKRLSDDDFERLFWDLEVGLMESNVAVEVVERLKQSLKMDLVGVPIDKSKIGTIVEEGLKNSISELFDYEELDLVSTVKKKKPFVILFLGINGSGKTTTIAKFAKVLESNRLGCVMAAADTFRAAAIEQLSFHGEKLGIKVIKHDYGADPAAVAYDAVKYAENKNLDVVLIDTAGRMHSNINLMDELKKIDRVVNPDMKVFVGESITGNDCIEQAKQFDGAIGVDGIVLTKADVDEKGGTAVSISYVVGKPIIFLATGQNYGDLEKFNIAKLMQSLGW